MSTTDATEPAKICLRTIEYVHQLGVVPSPQNYELFYQYAAGGAPELQTVLHELLQRPGKPHQTELNRIYETYVADRQRRAELAEMGDRLGDHLGDTLGLIRDVSDSNEEYTNSLSGARRRLVELSESEKIDIAFENLVQLAREMERKGRAFDAHIKESSEKIENLERRVDGFQSEMRTDALTGSANRAFFDKTINAEIARAGRQGTPFCLCMVDVDHFKEFNDSFGHRAGDAALRLVATAMKSLLREYDVVCRYGGDEFAIILPDIRLEAAAAIAERIRAALLSRPLVKRTTGEELGHIHVTIGISEYRPGDTETTLFNRADKCLYAAKKAGRNRVRSEPDEGEIATAPEHVESLAT